MRKLLTLGLASLFIVVTGCQDTNTTRPLDGPSFHEINVERFFFDMLDFPFAVEKTGASGSGQADVDGETVEIEVKAEGLEPGHDYELNVTIGPGFAFPPSDFEDFGPVTANDKGEVEFKVELDLDPGDYRLDLFVTHDHPTISEADFPVAFAFALPIFLLLDRDLLLRCGPAVFVTIEADD